MPDPTCNLTRKVNDLIALLEHHHTRTEYLITQSESLRQLILDNTRKQEEQSLYITETALAEVVRKLVITNKFVKSEQKRLKVIRFLFDWGRKWLKL